MSFAHTNYELNSSVNQTKQPSFFNINRDKDDDYEGEGVDKNLEKSKHLCDKLYK